MQSHSHNGEPVIYFKQDERREYPLFGIYTKDCLGIMENLISENDFRMHQVLKKTGGRSILVPSLYGEDKVFLNINTPEMYKAICRTKKEKE